MKKMNHPSLNGLKPMEQYLEELEKMYPNVPHQKIKEIEKKYFNETEMKLELEKLNKVEHEKK